MGYSDELLKTKSAPQVAQQSGGYADELLATKKMPAQSGMAGSVFIGSDVEKAAPAGANVGAGFIDDPRKRAEYYARKRFPNLSPEEAMTRYGVGEDGKVFYQADDGKLYYEVPQEGLSLPSILKRGAAGVADAVAAAPGAATGIATAPLMLTGPAGMAASVSATGLAGAAGEAIRQGIGNVIADDPVSVADMGRTAVIDAATQGIGGGVAKFSERFAARDLGRMNRPQVADLERKATAEGIDLTPAQKTNLPSLKNQQRVLSGMDGSADVMESFYQKQAQQSDTAIGRLMRNLSANDSLEMAGQRVKGAAFDAMEDAAKQRAQAAGPIYQEAFKNTVGINPAAVPRAEAIMGRMPRDVVREAMEIAKIEGLDLGDPRSSFKGMHYLKLALDRKINAGPWEGVSGAKKNALLGLKEELVTALDEISAKDVGGRSLYKLAREIYAHNSPMVESVREGLTGVIAGLKDDKARNAVSMLLDPAKAGPLSMKRAKNLIQRQDPEAWQQVKRAYLEDLWQNASTQFATSNPAMAGAKYAARVRGNPKQWEMLKEALEPKEFEALGNLLDVLEATGRGLRGNSETVEKAVTLRGMSREATGLAGMAATVADAPGKVLQGELGAWIREVRLGNHAEKVAEIITSPQGMEKLRQLKKLSPRDARFIAGLNQLAGFGVQTGMRGDRVDEPIYPTRPLPAQR